jgi:hypothetical protein
MRHARGEKHKLAQQLLIEFWRVPVLADLRMEEIVNEPEEDADTYKGSEMLTMGLAVK